MKDVSVGVLSEIISYMKYAKYKPELQRREIWSEIVDRNKAMHLKKFPELKDEIEWAYTFVYNKEILPSMRSMQFAGKPVEVNPTRIYNCSFLPMDHSDAFSEAMFLLLSGTGVGHSVQKHHIRKLPKIKGVERPEGRQRKKRYLIGDSIEGWSDAIKVLVESYFYGKREIDFDFRDIRPKGAKLITSGGKAPGPEPLREAIVKITSVFETALQERGRDTLLTSLEVHDIMCYIADAVLAGGIRRAAMISLFSFDDHEMLESKFGNWWEEHPERGRANNTAVVLRSQIKKKDFKNFWKKVEESGSGEPGIFFSNSEDWGINPCAEISLRANQFCNLVEINASNLRSQKDLNERAKASSFIATLQASFTDFHYLRDIWKDTTEKEALIGVSMTGVAFETVLEMNLKEAASYVNEKNYETANKIGINPAARTTAIKPSGTSSIVLGTSSGIHAWYDNYYWRRIRVGKNEAIYKYLFFMHPELIEDEFFRPESMAVISVPQKAPEDAILRHETAINTLERVKKFNIEWVSTGHREGLNENNVSCTINIKNDEWEDVGDWMWKNKDTFTAISVLPYNGGTYKQAPFETITEKEYYKALKHLTSIDLAKIVEEDDSTNLQGELACSGGSCEVTSV